MENYEEHINAMWAELNPDKHDGHTPAQDVSEQLMPESVILHGTCIADTGCLTGGYFTVGRYEGKLRLSYNVPGMPVNCKDKKVKTAKETVTVICDELSLEDGFLDDIRNRPKILNLSFMDRKATVEVLTRTGERIRLERKFIENRKRRTAHFVRTMITNADKGVSGFWTDDYEGCGNPAIYPKFEDGLKHGERVVIDHDICPWNTTILYGDGNGNIHTGCYHNCSIHDAKYLSPDMVRDVLGRFLERYENGEYEGVRSFESHKHINPLLTQKAKKHIEKARKAAEEEHEKQWKKREQARLAKAANLIARHPDDKYWKELISEGYGENYIETCEFGTMNFCPDAVADVETNGAKLSYDDFLDLQYKGVSREWLEHCYYAYYRDGYFKGQVQKKTKSKICFSRIYVGMCDAIQGDVGKEEHVWMDISGFEDINVGDCVSFSGEVYMYLKTGNGCSLDFGIRNPVGIERIEKYELPSDDEILMRSIDHIVCETCWLGEHCDRVVCIANKDEVDNRRKMLLDAIKGTGDTAPDE